MERGTVKWFDEAKGYGFITQEVGNKDIYVHRANVETMTQSLEKGDRVQFEVGEGRKGPEAKHVKLLNE